MNKLKISPKFRRKIIKKYNYIVETLQKYKMSYLDFINLRDELERMPTLLHAIDFEKREITADEFSQIVIYKHELWVLKYIWDIDIDDECYNEKIY